MGVSDYSVEMSFVNDKLNDDYEIVYIDRAGYGYSDDTSKPQTVEQVVSDYRTALENADIDGQYILLPHSLGGVYATYWESTYPDEIEGVILVDTSELGLDVWDTDSEEYSDCNYFNYYACQIGLHRLFIDDYVYPLPAYY